MPLLALIGFAGLAFYMYRPFVTRPFDMVDFSEFLPILRAHESFWSRFVGLTEYYASEGRLNVLVYFLLTLKWSLFGDSVVAWQAARAVQMLVLTVAVYALLLRLTVGPAGALLGAALLVVSAPAAHAWVKLTMAEPLAATTIIAAALCATYYQQSTRWHRLAIAIAALVMLTLLAKEILIAAVPLILFVGLCRQPSGRFGRPHAARRDVVLLTMTCVAAVAVLLPTFLVAMLAPAGAYAKAYGRLEAGPLDLLRLELFTLIPFVPLADPMPLGLAIADLCYFGLLAIGLRLFAESAQTQGHFRGIMLIGFIHPLIGAAGYLPWPAYHWFYSLPFLLGPAVLLGAAVAGVERSARRWRVVAYAAAGYVLASMASDSLVHARRAEASQFLAAAAIDVVARTPGSDSVFVARREVATESWQGFGHALAQYGHATGRAFPATVDISCDMARRTAQQLGAHSVLIVFSTECPHVRSPKVVIWRRFEWLDWGRGEWRRDSMSVAAFVGGGT